MNDNELKSYQALANKAFDDFLKNPTPLNHEIANDAAKLYKAMLIVTKGLNSQGDKTAEYIDPLLEEGD